MHGFQGEGSLSHLTPYFLEFLSSYGWIIATFMTIGFLLRKKIVGIFRSLPRDSSSKTGEQEKEEIQKQKEKQDEVRKQMQERNNLLAQAHAKKVKQEEAEKLSKRIAELNGKSVSGDGYRLGTSAEDSASATKPNNSRIQKNDYNPLMGAGGTGGFRPRRNCGSRGA